MPVTSTPQGLAGREAAATLVIVGAVAALAVGRPIWRRVVQHPTSERCAAMLDRYGEQESRARNRTPSTTHVVVGSPEVARCTAELTDAEVECALHAGYADELERCLP